MPKLNTTVKSVRIDNDKLEELEGRLAGKSINSWLNEQITDYLSGKKADAGVNPSKNSEKSEASPNKDLEEIDSMARFFGLTGESLLKEVCDGLMEGNLTVENGKIVGKPEINLDDFIDTCHEMAVDPQRILEKATQCLKRGQL